ncbi:hypothetical protein FGSG_07995 [Fusarium graminearum PH-1]|uniref:hypothetical protein n=1 Tax=Gibberella zeae (strain ATCC MYA-4620 / CBS 123657 / FGSC 9075 / NRRL 31084 / PH-1) TaxID=229533 RepID=UPI000023DF78|nr:hypothetical protein FGSG_07995 [Fusarium graminearum PH-1]ESU15413.1 hypothetical protein FGSG_07995 [Fusarium graminearum PH-1]|eukprot:XP_011320838.1 hypothetical protein FGSG_07995 [Fusarium graminearum PH-1]
MAHEIANENGEAENSTLLAPETINGAVSPSPSATSFTSSVETSGSDFTSSWEKLQDVYSQNIGLFYVLLAQLFASIMSMTTRLLATGFETKFHALQIIFVRMLATALIGSFYMWREKVPDFPLGPRNVRDSLSYLDVSDATVITFLVPTLTAFIAWVALREPFTLNEALAGLIAFTGVLFVARPAFLFPHNDSFLTGSSSDNESAARGILSAVKATPHERTIAICCSIFGSIAAATAYSTIRVIGKRAHSLVSVNYFAVLATISSFLIITIHPDLQFEIPKSLAEWSVNSQLAILLSIGVSGFLFQVLLTEGLQREKAGRATNLIYVQLVYAVIIDRVIWGTVPPPASFIGSALIIGSAIWVALQKKVSSELKPVSDEEKNSGLDKNGMKEA